MTNAWGNCEGGGNEKETREMLGKFLEKGEEANCMKGIYV
jgi:hypothetical protein